MNAIESAMVLDEVLNRRADAGRTKPARVCRAIVSQILDSGEVIVRASGPDASFSCEVLVGGGRLVLKANDPVLVLAPATPQERGVVLGRVGPYVPPTAQASEPVVRWEVEAGESLSLRCGESSIELRKDGRVLVKGKDIVSHARRLQRIKGGSVAIN